VRAYGVEGHELAGARLDHDRRAGVARGAGADGQLADGDEDPERDRDMGER
jgi:hypothetical protein